MTGNWLDAATDEEPEGSNAFIDSEIEAEDEQGAPEWLGVRWREIELHHQREAWIGLRRWVDWFAATFRLPAQTIPGCWFQHPGLVEELYAAMCLEHQVWASEEPGVAATTMWHHSLPGIVHRLHEATGNVQCSEQNGHIPLADLRPKVDEDQWAATLATRTLHKTVEHPETGTRGVRAVLIDHDGEEAATSRPAALVARTSEDTPQVQMNWGAATGWADEDIELLVTKAHNVVAVRWESSDDDGQTWSEFDTTEQEK